ncbi:MAG: ligase-associated DNA damage response endonuclease PdeM [Bdellovibrio sp.]|nr:ligase-associated DNA damage response endonuclease PdeM [Methylotenera sp.]
MKTEYSLIINNHQFLVLADKALYWPKHKALLIADAHFGKAAAYRALGQPVPQGTTNQNLQRLDALLNQYVVEQIIFLGDFLHAPKSHALTTLTALRKWRLQHSTMQCILIRGNHDVSAGDPPADLKFTVVNEPYLIDGFALQHIPKPHATHHVVAGHVHPVFRLSGKGRQSMTIPCLYHSTEMTLLPSFGEFTGGFKVENKPNCQLFLFDGQFVWPINC